MYFYLVLIFSLLNRLLRVDPIAQRLNEELDEGVNIWQEMQHRSKESR